MAKGRGGRPKKADGAKRTRQVRVPLDLADMIGEIVDVEPGAGTAADRVDFWLRPHVEAYHKSILPFIERMRQARSGAKKKSDRAAKSDSSQAT